MSRLAAAALPVLLALSGCAGWYEEQAAKARADDEAYRRRVEDERRIREEHRRRREAIKYDAYCARRGFVLVGARFGRISKDIECRPPTNDEERARIGEIMQEWLDASGH